MGLPMGSVSGSGEEELAHQVVTVLLITGSQQIVRPHPLFVCEHSVSALLLSLSTVRPFECRRYSLFLFSLFLIFMFSASDRLKNDEFQ